jgi:hypothetical protein
MAAWFSIFKQLVYHVQMIQLYSLYEYYQIS